MTRTRGTGLYKILDSAIPWFRDFSIRLSTWQDCTRYPKSHRGRNANTTNTAFPGWDQ